MALIHYLHKANIDALRKGRMRFDSFAQFFDVGIEYAIHFDNRMRISHIGHIQLHWRTINV